MKIVFLDRDTVGDVENLNIFEKYGEFISYPTTSAEQTIERCDRADIIITNKVVIDRQVMAHAPNLKLICIAATGMNNVDLVYAAEKNIAVRNVSGYSTHSVTQSTFSMLLHLLNKNGYYDEYVKSGDYAKSPIFTHLDKPFFELYGKVFGIIGMGTIGQSVARVASAFGCRVIYYSTSGKNQAQPGYRHYPLDELLRISDIVSVHAPLNEATLNLLDRSALRLMKKTALLINVGRGGIINEKDLASALDEGDIAGVGIDVLTAEPIHPENPLNFVKARDKIFITPHIAWASIEARTQLVNKIAENIDSYLNGND